MGSSRYIPWQKIKSWICLRCGGCCRRLKIVITPHEYARLLHYSEDLVGIDNTGNPVLLRVSSRCVAQDKYGLCALQHLGMKPLTCKVWPFTLFSNPKLHNAQALFIHKGREYFVYVDRAYPCTGVDRGNPEVLPFIIEEIVEIYEGPYLVQSLSTSNFGPGSASYESVRQHLALERRGFGLEHYGTKNLWETDVKVR